MYTIVRRHSVRGKTVPAHKRKVSDASLKFYDLGAKKTFTSSTYKVLSKNGRRFAVATGPSGRACYRILGAASPAVKQKQVESEDRFSVVIGPRGVQHYLNGVPIDGEEVRRARMNYGEPEHDEESDDDSYNWSDN